MKPKVSTGYLTPQLKKTKNASTAKPRLSNTEESQERNNTVFNDDLFETLMKCPEKKKLVLQLLSANKEVIGKELRKEQRKSIGSPVNKLKIGKKICESPTALLRRRALEQMSSSSSSSNRSGSARPGSASSDASSSNDSSIPFDKVLQGVIAYVEIKSANNTDRSGGAKAVLKSMGAEVRETFSRDVTHVIFKDGSYTTFHKAKLLNVHIVSILWVEFCRKTVSRQNENNYPAMRCGFQDETMVCSQMQKEYEDIIREEYRRSIMQGTPLPTTRSLIDRRRTLMTPSVTNLNSSSSSYQTAAESQEVLDKEVASINGRRHSQNIADEDLVLNDPECFSEVSGPVVNGIVVEKRNNLNIECSDMELTHIPFKSLVNSSDMELTTIPDRYSVQKRNSKKVVNKNRPPEMFDKRKTICNYLFSDSSTKSLISSSDKSTKESSLISDKSTNVSGAIPKVKSKTSRRLTRGSTSSLSDSDSFIFGKNTARSSKKLTTEVSETANAMSELKLSSSKDNSKSSAAQSLVQKSTSMSTLQISSESKKGSTISAVSRSLSINSSDSLKNHVSNSERRSKNSVKSSAMSVLQISCERISLGKSSPKKSRGKENKDNFSFESGSASVQSPEFITVRKKQIIRTSSPSDASEDSEILSPPKERVNRNKKTLVVNIVRSPLNNLDNLELDEGSKRQTLGKKQETSTKTSTTDANKSQKGNNNNGAPKVRKLYNPDASIHFDVDDEMERAEKRNQANKRKSDEGLVVNLGDVLEAIRKTPPQQINTASEIEIDITPPKRAKKGKKKQPLNNSADEQRDLLNEVLDRKFKTPAPRGASKVSVSKSQTETPSRRKSTRIIKPTLKHDASKISVTPSNRRSTLEFMSRSQLTSSKKKKKLEKIKLPTIVCTKLHKPDVEIFTQIVKKLGKFNTEDEVSDRTTHVVAGESKRTINMLRAIAKGCWIVKFDWVLQSLEEGKWLPEEDFEITDFSSAVQKCRLERQAFGDNYGMDVFESCLPIYVAPSSIPRASDLRELITTCKGKVVTIPRKAKIIVGQYLRQEDTVCVSESWILDCITFYKKLAFKDKYRLSDKRRSLAV